VLVVFPSSHRDYPQTVELLKWAHELQPHYAGHQALIVGSSTLSDDQIKELGSLAKSAGFGATIAIRQKEEDGRGWPYAPNQMFRLASQYVQDHLHCPFFWNEPDCIPLCPGWLDAIDGEYRQARKPFLGAVFDYVNATKKMPHLTGCAVYPTNINQYNPLVLQMDGVPWDCVRPELTLKHTHRSGLIQHDWGDRKTNEAPTFPERSSLDRIHTGVVAFHRNKDGTLIQRLREQANDVLEHPDMVAKAPSIFKRSAKSLLRGGSSYYHSGNLGDVIYALLAIKLHGGGDLLIGPEQNGTSPCANPITRSQFELFLPLLKQQPYLYSVEFREHYPKGDFQFDLNQFRNSWMNWRLRVTKDVHTLWKAHCYQLGVQDKAVETEPWITAGESPNGTCPILVHRSPRYQSSDFPWSSLVEKYRDRMAFIGLDSEHQSFIQAFGGISRMRFIDFEVMARSINSARCFVGNQSFPLSLALGLGKPVLCEEWATSPDCRFKRPNYLTQHSKPEQIEQLLKG